MMARRLVRGTPHFIFEGDRLHNKEGGHLLRKIQPIAREEGKVTELSGKNEIACEEGKVTELSGKNEIACEEGKVTELLPGKNEIACEEGKVTELLSGKNEIACEEGKVTELFFPDSQASVSGDGATTFGLFNLLSEDDAEGSC